MLLMVSFVVQKLLKFDIVFIFVVALVKGDISKKIFLRLMSEFIACFLLEILFQVLHLSL